MAANNGNSNNGNNGAMYPPFYFEGVRMAVYPAGILSAGDFISEVRRRQAAFHWSDEDTMPNVVAALRGEAATWFHHGLRLHEGTNYRFTIARWSTFLPVFRRTFLATAVDKSVPWQDLASQRKGEQIALYCNRIGSAFQEFGGCLSATAAAALDVVRLPEVSSEVSTIVDAIGEADSVDDAASIFRDCAPVFIRAILPHLSGLILDRAATAYTLHMASNGFTDGRIRSEASRLRQANPSISVIEFGAQLEQYELTLPKPKTAAVHAAHAETDDGDDAGDGDDAPEDVSAAHRPKAKKKPGPKTRHGFPADYDKSKYTPGATCSYCQRKHHTAPQCIKRKNAAGSSKAKAVDEPIVSYDLLTEPLNANGSW